MHEEPPGLLKRWLRIVVDRGYLEAANVSARAGRRSVKRNLKR